MRKALALLGLVLIPLGFGSMALALGGRRSRSLFGWRDRVNLPATIGEANWTYALPWPCDTLAAQPEAADCADRLARWSYQTGRWHPPLASED